MSEASVRDLRNHGGKLLDRVLAGERVTVTRDGTTEDVLERAARQARLQEAEAAFEPLPFDAVAARVFGRVAAGLRRCGRKPAARAFDALIAATAMANGMCHYTCNPRDYIGIDQLTVFGIAHPDHTESTIPDPDQHHQ
ncbi:MAG: type II toxin-antitoxin system prevent-host-death family antitoxin [Acidimicrobiales bacterium]